MQRMKKPDETETKIWHHNLYEGMSQKALCSAINLPSYQLSRRLNHTESTEDPLHEIIMEMIGSVESAQPSIGKAIYGRITRYAVELGLVDEPVDVLQMAIEKLRSITEIDIKQMGQEERFKVQGFAAELESLANDVKTMAIRIRNEEQGRGSHIELGGGGVRDRTTVGGRRF